MITLTWKAKRNERGVGIVDVVVGWGDVEFKSRDLGNDRGYRVVAVMR